MYKSYLVVALRNFWKDRTYTIINLLGLAVGFASVLMIVSYVRFELSYDSSYSNAPNIYRCIEVATVAGNTTKKAQVPQQLSKTLAAEYPEVTSFTSVWQRGFQVQANGKEKFFFSGITADANFFSVFNFPFLYGNKTALQKEGDVVLTQSSAEKIFPGINPIGQTILVENEPHLISGVVQNLPPNIHLTADMFLSRKITDEVLDYHGWSSSTNYILLAPGASIQQLQSKLKPFYTKYNFGDEKTLAFQPVQNIHLYSDAEGDPYTNSSIRYIYIFSAIGFLILSIACINYTNLTTARSLHRTREVGVRKVMGAARKQLAFQFLAESLILFIIVIPFAIILASLAWPSFATLLQISDVHLNITSGENLLFLFAISLVTGLLSGLYPAFFLSALRPVNIFSGWKNTFHINLNLRKALIVLQFAISVFLIIATIVVQAQLQYINDLNLGFNKEHLITLPGLYGAKNEEAFRQELLLYKDIQDVATAGFYVGQGYGSSATMTTDEGSTDQTGKTVEWKFSFIDADLNFVKTMQIPILQGRDFSETFASDWQDPDNTIDSLKKNNHKLTPEEIKRISSSQSIIITRKTAELIHLQKPYIGKIVSLPVLEGTVIGLIDDFKGLSIKEENPAIVIKAHKEKQGNTFIRIRPENASQTLAYIEKVWKEYYPELPYSFSFVDEQIQSLYDSEQHLASFFGIFAALGIGIACLGLFSLVALLVQQRTKEIGIRKVLGAGVKNILQLLSADFVKLVIISIVIASPIAGWAMHKWLQDYQSRIDISWWIFAAAGLLTLLIAIATVSIQAIKAATANPVKSLRTE